jgi:BirA family biotin operon repressor/biotin-[acetyl-CoA-carboxylase] ligase
MNIETQFDDHFVARVNKNLLSTVIGRPFLFFNSLDSTQNKIIEVEYEHPVEGLAVGAGYQEMGRGRFDRKWVGKKRKSVLMSVLLRPSPDQIQTIVMMAALAVQKCIQEIQPDLIVDIKWPNDLLVGGKKIAGILVEHQHRPVEEGGSFIVLGIGLNVNLDTTVIPEISEISTSLFSITNRDYDLTEVYSVLLNSLDHYYHELKKGTDLFTQWEGKLVTLGRLVRVTASDGTFEGLAESVIESGALVIRDTKTGSLRTVYAGDVNLIQLE